MFTREQLQEIKTLDQGRMEYHFACVIDSKFKRGTPGNADSRLYEIYEEATGEHLSLNGCKTCQYNNYLKVATLYNQSKQFYEKLDKEEEKAGEEVADMVLEMAGKKTPNKRKTTKKK